MTVRLARRGAVARRHSGNATIATDSFARTVAGGWGSADLGGLWTVRLGTAVNFSTDGSTARIAMPPAASQYANLPVSATTCEARVDFSPVTLPASGNLYAFAWLRVNGTVTNYYRIGVLITSGGVVSVRGETAGQVAVFADTPVGLTVTAGQWISVRVQVVGVVPTVIRAKAWAQGGGEPGWQAVGSDATGGVQAAGTVGIACYAESACTVAADNYSLSTSLSAATVPGTPATPTAASLDTAASVTFAAPANDGGSPILDYRVVSSPGGITVVNAPSPITVPGLTNGQSYTFTVAARNAAGLGAASAASNAVTPAAATVPGVPTGVTATGDNTQAQVNWTAPANGGSPITGYDIQPFIGGAGQALTSVSPVTATTVTGLTNGTAYTFKVRAKNAIGNSAYSAASNAVTPAVGGAGPQPTLANTGVQAGHTLTPVFGDVNLSAGQTLVDRDVTGNININGSNVTVDNCRCGSFGLAGGLSNITVTHVEANGIWINQFNGLTIDRCNFGGVNGCPVLFWSTGPGAMANLTFTNNYLAGFDTAAVAADAHIEIFHIAGLEGGLIQNNTFDDTHDALLNNRMTACVTWDVWGNGVKCDSIRYYGNYHISGGPHQIYIYGTNTQIRDNKFTGYGAAEVQYWFYNTAAQGAPYPPFQQSGNTLDGAPYALIGGFGGGVY